MLKNDDNQYMYNSLAFEAYFQENIVAKSFIIFVDGWSSNDLFHLSKSVLLQVNSLCYLCSYESNENLIKCMMFIHTDYICFFGK